MNRRELLRFALASPAACAPPVQGMTLVVLPVYSSRHKTVAQEFLDGVSAAIERTFLVRVRISAPELYDGPCEGNAVLDFLSQRPGRVMAATSGPLRAPVRDGMKTKELNVLGWADVPSERRERPRGCVVTTYGLWNMRDGAIARLGVVGIHEFAHNLGAWDCPSEACYMNGRIDLGYGTLRRTFCSGHRELLWPYLR